MTSTNKTTPEGGMTMAEPTSLPIRGRLVSGSSTTSSSQANSGTRLSVRRSMVHPFCQGQRQVGRHESDCQDKTDQDAGQHQRIGAKLVWRPSRDGRLRRIEEQVREKTAPQQLFVV